MTLTRQPDSATADVPLLLEPLKQALSIDFDDHDERLLAVLRVAVGQVERYTGGLLGAATVTLRADELRLDARLPVLPVRSLPTGYAVTEGGYWLFFPLTLPVAVSYEAGYDELPDALREAVIQCAANGFDGGTRPWQSLAAHYRVTSWAD